MLALLILLYMSRVVHGREAAILRNSLVEGQDAWPRGVREEGFLMVEAESPIKASSGDGTIDL